MTRILLIIAVIVLIVIGIQSTRKDTEVVTTTPPVTTESVKGCYVATLAKDVYTLNINTESQGVVAGTLTYNNFEKDSSKGVLRATYVDGILRGDYLFTSEGMDSIREVIFKKTADGFIPGYGPVASSGNKETFTDTTQITFDSSVVFKNTPCENNQ